MENWIDRFHGGRGAGGKRGGASSILSLNEILLIDVVDFFALCADEDGGSNTSPSIHLQQEQRSG